MEHPLIWISLAGLHIFAALSACHALLRKRDSRSALGWVAVILIFPPIGPFLYWMFGIARTESRAARLMRKAARRMAGEVDLHGRTLEDCPARSVTPEDLPESLRGLARAGQSLTGRCLLGGNDLIPLFDGEQAYPVMLEAIEQARIRVWLSTFIFDPDTVGEQFIDALNRAAARGCDVRLLTDGVGTFHPFSGWEKRLQGVRHATFIPPSLIPPQVFINLRTHRKVLVCDDAVAFTGGMNISDRHYTHNTNPDRVQDLHFRCAGPIACQLGLAFELDWAFVTGEQPTLETLQALEEPRSLAGAIPCRLLMDGPGSPGATMLELVCAQISAAKERVRIMSPYFLPPHQLSGALVSAVLRGVQVDVVLPGLNNHAFVDWAMRHQNPMLAEAGVRIWYQPPPFAHTKLLLVDQDYVLFGSTNLDPRSLNLNFELVVEALDAPLHTRLTAFYEGVRRVSLPAGLPEKRLLVRLRNAGMWLASPYL